MAEREEKANYDAKKGSGGGIVEVNPKPKKGVTSKVVDYIEKLMVKFMYDASQPHHYLSGNFAPVPDETPPVTDLPVVGHLPVITPICCLPSFHYLLGKGRSPYLRSILWRLKFAFF